MKRKVIIDTDPGIDDALAIIFALQHPEIEVLGFTSVGGNKGLQSTTDNVTRILNYFNSDIKVYKGSDKNYSKIVDDEFEMELDYSKENIHGADGLGSAVLEKNDALISDIDATTFILDTLKKYPNEVDIITLGPLTNLAFCMDEDMETMKQAKSIHSMGGGVHRGNRTPVAEFNYWYDPHSVNKVFELGGDLPIYMVGLDITHQAVLDMNDLTFMKLIDPKLGKLINEMLDSYIENYWENQRILGAVMHDLTAIVGYMYPELYTEVLHANMKCVTDNVPAIGQTVVDTEDDMSSAKNSYIPMKLDVQMYKENVIKSIFGQAALDEYIQHIEQ